ncbi:hypothetical protein BCD91_001800 [Clostridium beijerinckii]|nr:hypothetical protein [Clostridium beijerinckii]
MKFYIKSLSKGRVYCFYFHQKIIEAMNARLFSRLHYSFMQLDFYKGVGDYDYYRS